MEIGYKKSAEVFRPSHVFMLQDEKNDILKPKGMITFTQKIK